MGARNKIFKKILAVVLVMSVLLNCLFCTGPNEISAKAYVTDEIAFLKFIVDSCQESSNGEMADSDLNLAIKDYFIKNKGSAALNHIIYEKSHGYGFSCNEIMILKRAFLKNEIVVKLLYEEFVQKKLSLSCCKIYSKIMEKIEDQDLKEEFQKLSAKTIFTSTDLDKHEKSLFANDVTFNQKTLLEECINNLKIRESLDFLKDADILIELSEYKNFSSLVVWSLVYPNLKNLDLVKIMQKCSSFDKSWKELFLREDFYNVLIEFLCNNKNKNLCVKDDVFHLIIEALINKKQSGLLLSFLKDQNFRTCPKQFAEKLEINSDFSEEDLRDLLSWYTKIVADENKVYFPEKPAEFEFEGCAHEIDKLFANDSDKYSSYSLRDIIENDFFDLFCYQHNTDQNINKLPFFVNKYMSNKELESSVLFDVPIIVWFDSKKIFPEEISNATVFYPCLNRYKDAKTKHSFLNKKEYNKFAKAVAPYLISMRLSMFFDNPKSFYRLKMFSSKLIDDFEVFKPLFLKDSKMLRDCSLNHTKDFISLGFSHSTEELDLWEKEDCKRIFDRLFRMLVMSKEEWKQDNSYFLSKDILKVLLKEKFINKKNYFNKNSYIDISIIEALDTDIGGKDNDTNVLSSLTNEEKLIWQNYKKKAESDLGLAIAESTRDLCNIFEKFIAEKTRVVDHIMCSYNNFMSGNTKTFYVRSNSCYTRYVFEKIQEQISKLETEDLQKDEEEKIIENLSLVLGSFCQIIRHCNSAHYNGIVAIANLLSENDKKINKFHFLVRKGFDSLYKTFFNPKDDDLRIHSESSMIHSWVKSALSKDTGYGFQESTGIYSVSKQSLINGLIRSDILWIQKNVVSLGKSLSPNYVVEKIAKYAFTCENLLSHMISCDENLSSTISGEIVLQAINEMQDFKKEELLMCEAISEDTKNLIQYPKKFLNERILGKEILKNLLAIKLEQEGFLYLSDF